jgi:hypothetical protein
MFSVSFTTALFILALFVAFAVIFIWTHLRPLAASELDALAAKRRKNKINVYFQFSPFVIGPNLDFKRGMAAEGKFYNFHEPLNRFPSVVASWLKYKKHEWMVVGMEKTREVSLVWANKGKDRTRVCLGLPFERLARIAVSGGYASMLVFHNHPNPNPGIYSCSQPSPVDLNSSTLRAKILNEHGINLVEFVCERGVAHKYCFSPANSFLPIELFTSVLRDENGVSKMKNLSLHIERMF